jgi:hypothetical protein
MPKRVKHKRPTDVNQAAYRMVELSTQEPINPEPPAPSPSPSISDYMAQIGSKGGKIGGKRRLKTMTPDERRKIAKKAAKARWKKT